MEFNLIIKDRRTLLGLTQQDLADYSGLSPRIIKSIEVGKGNPSVGTLTKIADVLGLEFIMKVRGGLVNETGKGLFEWHIGKGADRNRCRKVNILRFIGIAGTLAKKTSSFLPSV